MKKKNLPHLKWEGLVVIPVRVVDPIVVLVRRRLCTQLPGSYWW